MAQRRCSEQNRCKDIWPDDCTFCRQSSAWVCYGPHIFLMIPAYLLYTDARPGGPASRVLHAHSRPLGPLAAIISHGLVLTQKDRMLPYRCRITGRRSIGYGPPYGSPMCCGAGGCFCCRRRICAALLRQSFAALVEFEAEGTTSSWRCVGQTIRRLKSARY